MQIIFVWLVFFFFELGPNLTQPPCLASPGVQAGPGEAALLPPTPTPPWVPTDRLGRLLEKGQLLFQLVQTPAGEVVHCGHWRGEAVSEGKRSRGR